MIKRPIDLLRENAGEAVMIFGPEVYGDVDFLVNDFDRGERQYLAIPAEQSHTALVVEEWILTNEDGDIVNYLIHRAPTIDELAAELKRLLGDE